MQKCEKNPKLEGGEDRWGRRLSNGRGRERGRTHSGGGVLEVCGHEEAERGGATIISSRVLFL